MKRIISMKNIYNSINKFYLFNTAVVSTFVVVVVMNFVVQFKVESLQQEVKSFELKISDYKKQIKYLEIEWAYLTRPSRLRDLSQAYLKGNRYTLASQIKSDTEMKQLFAANYERSKTRQIAGNF